MVSENPYKKQLNGKITTVLFSLGKIEDNTPNIKKTLIREVALASAKQERQKKQRVSQRINAV